MLYKAESENGEIKIFIAENRDKAIEKAFIMTKNYGNLFRIVLMGENYNEIK